MYKIITLGGQLETLGPSRSLKAITIYDYISIKESGGDVILKNVRVPEDVDRMLNPGIQCNIVLTKNVMTGIDLVALKSGDREAFNPFLQGGIAKYMLVMGFIFLFSIPLSFIIIGIPLLLVSGLALFFMPAMKHGLIRAAKDQGFNLTPVRTI